MTEVHPALLGRFVRSLAMLALPYEAQVAWLSSLGLGEPEFIDELALEFDDGVLLLRQFIAAGWVDQQLRDVVTEIDAQLALHSGPEQTDFQHLDSLRSSPEWARIRELALQALTQI